MEFLNFDFGHPVEGHANLLQLATPAPKHHTLKINSKKDNLLHVPIDTCCNGKWRLTLDWEHDGKSYVHEQEFEVSR